MKNIQYSLLENINHSWFDGILVEKKISCRTTG